VVSLGALVIKYTAIDFISKFVAGMLLFGNASPMPAKTATDLFSCTACTAKSACFVAV